MKPFMDQDFLLTSGTAKTLYHSHAAKQPIVDYHCHINPRQIYENHRFADISEAWLGGDHYKWRLMRTLGVEEEKISGGATGWEKFRAFAAVLPQAVGNPVYHWAHLELQRYFGCHTPLGPDTAEEIWNHCNRLLATDEGLRVRGIIEKSGVKALMTTDDPADSLEWHAKIAQDNSFSTAVLPAFRPDAVCRPAADGYAAYIRRLGQAAGVEIKDIETLKKALQNRMDHFAAHGCRASDHGIDSVDEAPATGAALTAILQKALAGTAPTANECSQLTYAMMQFFGEEYARRGWVMEIHVGAARNVNTPAFAQKGPDTGFDAIRPTTSTAGMAALLSGLLEKNALPKTLLFSLEPGDNAALVTLAGCFQQAGIQGRVQQGAAWWFNDTKAGMTAQLTTFADLSVLGAFVGMLTDSRSFLSYTRHEYFRRILCELLGGWVEAGEYPADMKTLGQLVENISYHNAVAYFSLEEYVQ